MPYIQFIGAASVEPPASDATLLLHFDGADGETNIVDSSVHEWAMTGHDACKISTAQAKWGSSSLRLSRSVGNEGMLAISMSPVLAYPASSPWWVEFWFYASDIAASTTAKPFYFQGDDGSSVNEVSLLKFGSNFFSGMAWSGGSEGSMPAIPPNTWAHIAVCYDGTTRRRFVNGVLAGSVVHAYPPSNSLVGTVYVGGLPSGTDTTSDGVTEVYIDELRFLLGSCPFTANFTPPTGPY